MSKWVYKGKNLSEAPEGKFGFIYRITCIKKDSEFYGWTYIGSKQFVSITNPRISAKRSKELYKGTGRRPTKERKIKKADWENYLSSSTTLKKYILENSIEDFLWEIIRFANNSSELDYKETEDIIREKQLLKKESWNYWINVKIHKKGLC